MNFAPFYIGQYVVAVNAIPTSIIKNGKIYEISNCYYAPSGNPIANGKSFWYVGIEGFSNHSLRHTIFAPLIQKKFPLMTVKQIMEKEKNEVLIDN